jgi:hypothetical protein
MQKLLSKIEELTTADTDDLDGEDDEPDFND